MKISHETVARVAKLARIGVSREQAQLFAGELSAILGWIGQLKEVDTEDVEPVHSVMDISAVWRPDEVIDGGKTADILDNAPKQQHSHFVVPKVVE